jgi:hypothetical protein
MDTKQEIIDVKLRMNLFLKIGIEDLSAKEMTELSVEPER